MRIPSLDGIKGRLKRKREEALTKAAEYVQMAVSKRIFVEGLDVNELPIGTRRGGTRYESSYAKRRKNSGLQIQKIDYFFTGRLASQLKVVKDIGRAAKVAIIGDRAKISGYLESRRGVAFGLTKYEKALAKKVIRDSMKLSPLR